MTHTAVLGAENIECPDFGGSKPELGVSAGYQVLLHAERGNEEAVEHVLGLHNEPDGPVVLHVKFVYRLLAVVIIKRPEPLLSLNANFYGVLGRCPHVLENHITVNEKHDEKYGGYHGPDYLEGLASRDVGGFLVFALSPVFDSEIYEHYGDEYEEYKRHQSNQKQYSVNLACQIRCYLGNPSHEFLLNLHSPIRVPSSLFSRNT